VVVCTPDLSKGTEQKFIRERIRRERRARKLLRRQKRMPAKNNTPVSTEALELSKYASELIRIETLLVELAASHKQRDELTGELGALQITRSRLDQSILDEEAPASVLLENMRELGDERLLLESSLEALAPRIQQKEQSLHQRLPESLSRFGRLRDYARAAVLESCRGQVRALVDPSAEASVEDRDLNGLAILLPDYIRVSKIAIPSLSWSWSRPLDEKPMHWNSLVRPPSEAELAAQRRETIDCLVSAARSLCEAGKALVEAVTPFAQGCPAFEPEPEPAPTLGAAEIATWNEPLHGSDREFFEAVCKQGGRDPDNLSDREKEIMARMMAERRRPYEKQSLGNPELIGATTLAEDAPPANAAIG
jgi:hypothetical protein